MYPTLHSFSISSQLRWQLSVNWHKTLANLYSFNSDGLDKWQSLIKIFKFYAELNKILKIFIHICLFLSEVQKNFISKSELHSFSSYLKNIKRTILHTKLDVCLLEWTWNEFSKCKHFPYEIEKFSFVIFIKLNHDEKIFRDENWIIELTGKSFRKFSVCKFN